MTEVAAPAHCHRIGEVAALVGTTPRTIRYYEEIGLLSPRRDHEKGRHRTYDEGDVARLRELLRFRDLLGIPLEELKSLLDAEAARAGLRERWQQSGDAGERRDILAQAVAHVETQLSLVSARREALTSLERELGDKRRRLRAALRRIEKETL